MCFALLLFLPQLTHSASVSGIVWDAVNSGPISGAAVEINTTPLQRDVTGPDGSYIFQLGPGDYGLVVKKINADQELEQVASQEIKISADGNYTVDILAFYQDIEVPDFGNDPGFEIPSVPEQKSPGTGARDINAPLLIAFLAIAMLILFFLVVRKKGEKQKPEEQKGEVPAPKPGAPPKKRERLPPDLKQVIKVMKRNEGRMTQLELRKEIPLSEAKVSLMITDLESRGLVRRIKQGRGNILILKEEG